MTTVVTSFETPSNCVRSLESVNKPPLTKQVYAFCDIIKFSKIVIICTRLSSSPSSKPNPRVVWSCFAFGFVWSLYSNPKTQHFLPQVLRCGADMVGVCMMGWHVRKIFPTPNNYAENEKYNSTIKTRHIS